MNSSFSTRLVEPLRPDKVRITVAQTGNSLLKASMTPGFKISVRWWKNFWNLSAPPRGTVFLFHGIGEHSSRYSEFANFLCAWGFDVLSFDLPGHGLSARKGAYQRFADFDEMLADAQDLYRYWNFEGPCASAELRAKPFYFVAHSMGSLLMLYWMTRGRQENDVLPGPARIVVSAAPLKLQLKVPAWKEKLAIVLKNHRPDLKLGNEITPDSLSHDFVKVSEYLRDPWRSSKASPKLYFSLKSTSEFIAENARNVEVPTLVISGSRDKIIDLDALKSFYGQLDTHKRWLQFQGMRHEVLNEIGRSQVFEEVLQWLMS